MIHLLIANTLALITWHLFFKDLEVTKQEMALMEEVMNDWLSK